MRFSEHVVSRPAADAFQYIAEFENTADWDPGIAESRKLTDGPLHVGAKFDVVALFRGKRKRFRYTVTEVDDGRLIVLEGVGAKATSVDAITVNPSGSGSRISYTADIQLKGLRRLAEPLLGLTNCTTSCPPSSSSSCSARGSNTARASGNRATLICGRGADARKTG